MLTVPAAMGYRDSMNLRPINYAGLPIEAVKIHTVTAEHSQH